MTKKEVFCMSKGGLFLNGRCPFLLLLRFYKILKDINIKLYKNCRLNRCSGRTLNKG